jgi:hypothetical protein
MPPVGEITEKTDEDSRSNRRPIELIDSLPAIPDPTNGVEVIRHSAFEEV